MCFKSVAKLRLFFDIYKFCHVFFENYFIFFFSPHKKRAPKRPLLRILLVIGCGADGPEVRRKRLLAVRLILLRHKGCLIGGDGA